MERQDRSCRDLAYSTSVAMDDREVSSRVLMNSDQYPDAAAKLSGKGNNGIHCGCYRGVWGYMGHVLPIHNNSKSIESEGCLILLYSL